jgi:hypothetical protein
MSASEAAPSASCVGCGAPLPDAARFCPGCGRPVDPETGTTVRSELPASETGPVPVSIAYAEPRWFGVTPPMVLLVLSLAGFVLAVVLFAIGHWPVGLILVGVAILLFTGFLEVARRKPDAAVTRLSAEAIDGMRARAGSALEALAARGRAGREAARLRNELVRLHAHRRELLVAFGDAVYRGDDPDPLRRELEAVDEHARGLEAELHELLVATRERIEKARLAVQDTQMVQVPEPYPPPDEGTPPMPVPIPEPSPPPDEGTPPQPDPVPTPGPAPPVEPDSK